MKNDTSFLPSQSNLDTLLERDYPIGTIGRRLDDKSKMLAYSDLVIGSSWTKDLLMKERHTYTNKDVRLTHC